MTPTLSAACRMPHSAFVAAPAPLASGVVAEPCAPSHRAVPFAVESSGIITPALEGRLGGSDRGGRLGGGTRPVIGGGWQDWAQLAGGGPLRR